MANFHQVFKRETFTFLKSFLAKVFGFKILILYLFLKCWKFKENIVFWELVFGLKILYLFGVFPKHFSLFQTLCFLTLELIILSYL